MNNFANSLKTLLEEQKTDVKTLQKYLGFSSSSSIYKWLNGQTGIRLDTAVKIADFFNCSLDFLLAGKEDYGKEGIYKPCPPFGKHLKELLDEKGVSQYNIAKNTSIKGAHLYMWLHANRYPQADSAILLADYLGVSLDYLTGRE